MLRVVSGVVLGQIGGRKGLGARGWLPEWAAAKTQRPNRRCEHGHHES
jgi:hypothetical protein